MASTRTEREQDIADGNAPAAWEQRPIFGESTGLPWWAAIVLALVLSAVGAAVDLQLSEKPPTIIFQATYFVACVAAVCWVRRRNLFGPMVQPPLVLAIVLIALNIVQSGWPKEFNLKEFLLSYGIPVINSFPAMAVVTGVTLAIGLFRLFWQRDPERGSRGEKPAKQPPKERKPRPLDDEPPSGRRRRGSAAGGAASQDGVLDDVSAAAAAPTRAARPVAPPAGRTALRADRPPARRARATDSPATGARAAADPPARGRITDDAAVRGRSAEPPGGRRRRGEGTGGAAAAGQPPRRGAAANRARPLDDSAPHQRDSAPRRRPNETLAPRPQPPSRRQLPPQRPWEADQASPPERRRAQPPGGGQPPRKPLRGERPERPERPEPGDAADLRRRISGRRPPPPPRSRRWDSDDRG